MPTRPAATKRKTRRRNRIASPGKDLTTNRQGGLPRTLKIQSRYTEFGSLSPGAGTMTSYVYSANGIYDPNITGGGHKSLYFDQLMKLYDHYVVIGSKATVRLINQDPAFAAIAGVRLTDSSASVTASVTLLENARHVSKVLGPRGSANVATVTAKCNPAKFLRGTSKGVLQQKKLQGSLSTNPDEQCFWQIFATAADGSTSGVVVQYIISVEYQIVFMEPKQNVLGS